MKNVIRMLWSRKHDKQLKHSGCNMQQRQVWPKYMIVRDWLPSGIVCGKRRSCCCTCVTQPRALNACVVGRNGGRCSITTFRFSHLNPHVVVTRSLSIRSTALIAETYSTVPSAVSQQRASTTSVVSLPMACAAWRRAFFKRDTPTELTC